MLFLRASPKPSSNYQVPYKLLCMYDAGTKALVLAMSPYRQHLEKNLHGLGFGVLAAILDGWASVLRA